MAKHTPAHGHITDPNVKSPQNYCFACGKDNDDGMHLKFYFDEEARQAICEFQLEKRYQGPPGHAHGGIIATILDEAMGKVNKLSNVVALTKSMSIEYLKPVPLEAALKVTGREHKIEGRLHTNVAEISNAQGEILARSTGTFVAVDIGKMFNKFIPPPATAT
jgi:uncharacterized protein (TIGR00369 family)